jgi:ubiquinol-cytochrome c reductase cytochrome b subunit
VLSQISTFLYFAHFLLVLPLLGLFERPTPMPGSILESVLGKQVPAGSGMPAGAAAAPQSKG